MLSDLQRAVQNQIGPLVTQPGKVAVGAGTGKVKGDSVSEGTGSADVAAVIGEQMPSASTARTSSWDRCR